MAVILHPAPQEATDFDHMTTPDLADQVWVKKGETENTVCDTCHQDWEPLDYGMQGLGPSHS